MLGFVAARLAMVLVFLLVQNLILDAPGIGLARPRVNPNSREILLVSGRVPPGLGLSLHVLYVSTDMRCPRAWSVFSESRGPRRVWFDYPVTVVDGRYEVGLGLDTVRPAWCGWRVEEIGYSVQKGDAIRLVSLTPVKLIEFSNAAPEHDGRRAIRCAVRPARPPSEERPAALYCDTTAGRLASPRSLRALEVDVEEVGWDAWVAWQRERARQAWGIAPRPDGGREQAGSAAPSTSTPASTRAKAAGRAAAAANDARPRAGDPLAARGPAAILIDEHTHAPGDAR